MQEPKKIPIPKKPRLPAKRKYEDIFNDQEGGRVQLISPTWAGVQQAKALLKRRKKCKYRKGCKQYGQRSRKVYNRKRKGRISKHRRHGRK